jgi:hypothetical protein
MLENLQSIGIGIPNKAELPKWQHPQHGTKPTAQRLQANYCRLEH